MNKNLKIMLKSMALGLVFFVGLASAEPINFTSDVDHQSVVVDSSVLCASPLIRLMLNHGWNAEIHHTLSPESFDILRSCLSCDETMKNKEVMQSILMKQMKTKLSAISLKDLDQLACMIEYYQIPLPDLSDAITSVLAESLKSFKAMKFFKNNPSFLKDSCPYLERNHILVKKLLDGFDPTDFSYNALPSALMSPDDSYFLSIGVESDLNDDEIGCYSEDECEDFKHVIKVFIKDEASQFVLAQTLNVQEDVQVLISPDSSYFVLIHQTIDKMLEIWRRQGNQSVLVQILGDKEGWHYYVMSVSISPDGSFFISADASSSNPEIKVWRRNDVDKFVLVQKINSTNGGPVDKLRSILISRDGRYFVSFENDHHPINIVNTYSIKIWKRDKKDGKDQFVLAKIIHGPESDEIVNIGQFLKNLTATQAMSINLSNS